jgi:hypothetical protein
VRYYASTLLLQSLILTLVRCGDEIAFQLLYVWISSQSLSLLYAPCLHPCTDSHAEHATGTRRSSQETSIIVGSLLSYWLFRENHLARRIAGAVVVLTGIAIISLRLPIVDRFVGCQSSSYCQRGSFVEVQFFHHQFDRKAMPHSTIGFIIINGKSGIE